MVYRKARGGEGKQGTVAVGGGCAGICHGTACCQGWSPPVQHNHQYGAKAQGDGTAAFIITAVTAHHRLARGVHIVDDFFQILAAAGDLIAHCGDAAVHVLHGAVQFGEIFV